MAWWICHRVHMKLTAAPERKRKHSEAYLSTGGGQRYKFWLPRDSRDRGVTGWDHGTGWGEGGGIIMMKAVCCWCSDSITSTDGHQFFFYIKETSKSFGHLIFAEQYFWSSSPISGTVSLNTKRFLPKVQLCCSVHKYTWSIKNAIHRVNKWLTGSCDDDGGEKKGVPLSADLGWGSPVSISVSLETMNYDDDGVLYTPLVVDLTWLWPCKSRLQKPISSSLISRAKPMIFYRKRSQQKIARRSW